VLEDVEETIELTFSVGDGLCLIAAGEEPPAPASETPHLLADAAPQALHELVHLDGR
jgi:hypothetical protein